MAALVSSPPHNFHQHTLRHTLETTAREKPLEAGIPSPSMTQPRGPRTLHSFNLEK